VTINDLVEKIYRMNNIKDDFWRGYLDRIKSGKKVTWHHSSGMDWSPLSVIRSLTTCNHPNRNEELRIRKHIAN